MQDQNQIQNQTAQKVTYTPHPAGHHVQPPEVSGHKEHGPIITNKTEFTNPVDLRPEIAASHPEVNIPPELEKTIEKSPSAQEPKIENTPAKLAKESTPVSTTPSGYVHLPMTYKEALQKEKNSNFWDSLHWYAAQIIYLCRKNKINNINK